MNVHVTEPATSLEAETVPTPEGEAKGINSLVQRVAEASMKEIDDVLADLANLRTLLENEAERVQRELTNFSQLNAAALRAMKKIAEGLPMSGVSAPSEQQGLLEVLRRAPTRVR